MLSALKHFRHRKHEVIVFHLLDSAEKTFPFQGAISFSDLETGQRLVTQADSLKSSYLEQLNRFIQDYQRGCGANMIDYVQINTDTPFDHALSAYLSNRQSWFIDRLITSIRFLREDGYAGRILKWVKDLDNLFIFNVVLAFFIMGTNSCEIARLPKTISSWLALLNKLTLKSGRCRSATRQRLYNRSNRQFFWFWGGNYEIPATWRSKRYLAGGANYPLEENYSAVARRK